MNQQRIEQIKGYLGMMAMLHDNGDAGDALAIIEQLEAEVKRLKAALELYADHDNWDTRARDPLHLLDVWMLTDNGYETAEEALEGGA